MGKSNLDNLEMDLVIVASQSWSVRIAQLVQDRFYRRSLPQIGQILFCQSVYEAAATIIELLQQDRAVNACIMVDYLPGCEMKVFQTLNTLSRVRSIAFSGYSQRRKLVQAQQLGADELLSPVGQVDLETARNGTQDDRNESPELDEIKGPEPISEPSPGQPTHTSSPSAAFHEDEPLLSQEEIDALLNETR